MDTLNLSSFNSTLFQFFETLGASFLHLALIFIGRHWILAFVNSGMTILLGLGLLRLLPRSPIVPTKRRGGLRDFLSRDRNLRLRRFLLVVVLCKGAFYLILGDNHDPIHRHPFPFMFGFQIPDLKEVLRLVPQTVYTIWRPTIATEQVGIVLGGLALVLLMRRAHQVMLLLSCLKSLAVVSKGSAGSAGEAALTDLEAQVKETLGRAGAALKFSPKARLPRILLAEAPVTTPLLVGLTRPYILLAPSLVQALTPTELELALRHELAHFRRRDHLWRWPLLWLEDVGRLNPFSKWISERAVDTEEDICDQWAVTSSRDAAALVRAIAKSEAHILVPLRPAINPQLAGLASATQVLPFLLGHNRPDQATSLNRRLQGLLRVVKLASPEGGSSPVKSSAPCALPSPEVLAAQLANNPSVPPRSGLAAGMSCARLLLSEGWTLLIVALLLLVIYTKFFVVIFVH